jgi:hypothetical protein
MCAIRSPIGIASMVVGISRVRSVGGADGGGGGVTRPEGALRFRRRCLSDDVCGSGAVARAGVGITSGRGGNGPVGGGLGGTRPWDKVSERAQLSTALCLGKEVPKSGSHPKRAGNHGSNRELRFGLAWLTQFGQTTAELNQTEPSRAVTALATVVTY